MAHNCFESPDRGPWGRLQNLLANSVGLARLRRAIFARLPFPVLASDVRDVVYASWVVPLDEMTGEIPPGVAVLARDGRTILTALTYRHGGFGPALAGPLRRLLPSPRQSNWRLYLAQTGVVLFVKNIFDSTLYALGTRLFSDVLPSHKAARFDLGCDADGCRIEIGGPGSAPGLKLEAQSTDLRTLPPAFAPFFSSWNEAVQFLCLQHAAIASIQDVGALAWAEIDLPIDLDTVQPLETTSFTPGAWLTARGASADPFCFRVPAVAFRVLSEVVKDSL